MAPGRCLEFPSPPSHPFLAFPGTHSSEPLAAGYDVSAIYWKFSGLSWSWAHPKSYSAVGLFSQTKLGI